MTDAEQPDPMLDEIRAIREQISREHGDDLDRLFEHYVEYEKQFKGRLISRTMTPEEELTFRKGLEELRRCNPGDLDLLTDEVPASTPSSPPTQAGQARRLTDPRALGGRR